MTHQRMATIMGLMMGAMFPLAIHNPGSGGAVFVLAHLAVLLGGLALVLLVPGIRELLRRHRPDRAALTRMAAGAAIAFAVVCTHCLLTLHGSV